MKIEDIIKAGYKPTKFNGKFVAKSYVNANTGVLMMQLPSNKSSTMREEYVSIDRDHTSLNIEFAMTIEFNEETASGLLLSDVSPLFKQDIRTQRVDNLKSYLDERAHKKALLAEGSLKENTNILF